MKAKNKRGNEVSALSAAEILSAILLFGGVPFPEQAIYRFFSKLESSVPELAGRFRVMGPLGHQRSEPVRQALSFLEMGKLVVVPSPNPVDQFYRPRSSQLSSLRATLEHRGVLPKYEPLLKELAQSFKESL